MKAKHKPVIVDCHQWFDGNHPDVESVVIKGCQHRGLCFFSGKHYLIDEGDWIMKEANGHTFCLPDKVFQENWEVIDDS